MIAGRTIFTMLPSRVEMNTPAATKEKTIHLFGSDASFFIQKAINDILENGKSSDFSGYNACFEKAVDVLTTIDYCKWQCADWKAWRYKYKKHKEKNCDIEYGRSRKIFLSGVTIMKIR